MGSMSAVGAFATINHLVLMQLNPAATKYWQHRPKIRVQKRGPETRRKISIKEFGRSATLSLVYFTG